MTTDEKTPDRHRVRIEKHFTEDDAERWCKTLAPDFPAASYWLCHEAQILQEFHNSYPCVAKFLSLDIERRTLVTEAPGYPLSQLLSVPAERLQHPFQRSSDLIRLLKAVCQAVASLHAKGVVHGGLRLDNILLGLTEEGRVDFDSVKINDFANAHSHRHPIEKPPFLDAKQSAGSSGLSEALLKALTKDWETYARICKEEGKSSWDELSDKAKLRYRDILIPSLQINQIDWRADLYALGYWFRQLSLWRIDYHSDDHQERFPKLLKKMQRPVWQGGFKNMETAIRELETFELDPYSPAVSANPEFAPLEDLTPQPKSGQPTAGSVPDFPDFPSVHVQENRAMPSLGGSRPATGTSQPPFGESTPRKKPTEKEKSDLAAKVNWKAAALVAVAVIWIAAWFGVSERSKHPTATAEEPAKLVTPAPPSPAAAAPSPTPAFAPVPTTEKPAPAPATTEEAPPANDKDAFAYYLKRAEKNDAAAQARIGQMYREGRGTKQSFTDAVKWYRKAAEQGNAEGQARLGFMYMTGLGVKKDDGEAFKWQRKAAEQGNSIGQYNLGLMYLNGRGTAPDTLHAYMWLKLASATDTGAREKLRTLIPRMKNLDVLEAERLADEWRGNHHGTP